MPEPKPTPRAHPKRVGDQTTAKVLAALLEMYEIVLLPFGENQRYDLLVDTGADFLRVQCKTGRLRNGAVKFPSCSVSYHHPNQDRVVHTQRNYRGEADFFGVYCPETARVYLVPVDIVGTRSGCLRVDETKNGQAKKIRWASDYEISAQAGTSAHEPTVAYILTEARNGFDREIGLGVSPG